MPLRKSEHCARLLPALLLSGLAAAPAAAGVNRWTVTGPPLQVRAMAVDPHDESILYAVAPGAVARSADRGATWTVTPLGVAWPAAIRVAVSRSSTVYALGAGGLYRSASGGLSWSRRTVPIAAPFQNDLQVHPTNEDVLVMACSNLCVFGGCGGGGVFRSDDGGESWRAAGLKDTNVSHVAFDSFSPAVLYAISGRKLFRTADGGRAWREISPPAGGEVESVAVDPVIPSTLYAAATTGVFVSSDSGHVWRRIRDATSGGMVATPAYGHSQLFAAAAGTALTMDRGESWRELQTAGSGLAFGSLWQLAVSREVYYMVSDIVGAPGQILAYEVRGPRRRSVRP